MTQLLGALKNYLPDRCGNNADFIAKVLAAGNLELQILPRALGRQVEGTKFREHDGHRLFAIRHPRNSATDPDWREPMCCWPLDFADRIGSTGHSASGSLFVGFDVDAVAGHAPGVGFPDAERERICAAVKPLRYVEVRRSTGGMGIHLYVWLEGFATSNHHQHAALARCALGKICHDAQLDFVGSVDCCGGNMWFWRHDPTADSFRLLKPADQILTPDDVPNWREHLDVVTRKRTRIQVNGLDVDEAASFPAVGRDEAHERILADYRQHGFALEYLPDFRCYRAHTAGLAKTHKALALAGAFNTVSEGSDPGTPNCFVFLRPNGGMFVVRYGSTSEHALWDKTTKGQPCIAFNVPLKPEAACRAVDAIWTGPGKFTCVTVEQATRAAKLFRIDLPELSERPVNFTFRGDGLAVEADRQGKETPEGWGLIGRKLRRHFQIDQPPEDHSYDNIVRHIVTPTNEDAGWVHYRTDGTIGIESKDTLRDVLEHRGLGKKASAILGACAMSPWTLVNEPFQPEFLPGRRWNRHGKKLIAPSQGESREHPHYDMILDHCGRDLDCPVTNNQWCKSHGIKCGSDYLRYWAASIIQRPKRPLPYLFFWSLLNNTGKSAFHRALSMLILGDDGATDVYLSLMEKFNQPMAGCVLGYIEDKGLNAAAYARLKSWVDSPMISIRAMNTNAYTLPNYGHFVHTANHLDACPIEQHDERVVVVEVAPLERDIPWTEEMCPALRREAADFLATLLAMPLPPAAGRLFLPVLETPSKHELTGMAAVTDNRRAVLVALVSRIVQLVRRADYWCGFGGNLLVAIGPGPWTNSPATLVSYLHDAVDMLHQHGIAVSIASTVKRGQREINIGRTWLVEPEWSEDELAADEIRIAQIL